MRRKLTDGFRKAAAAFAAVMLISAAWAGVSESHAGVVGKGNGGSAGSTASFTIPEFTPRATAQKSGGYYFNGSGMYTFEQLGADLAALNGRTGYRYSSIGKTPDGRDIWQVVLGDPSASKKILVVGTMHGREYITTPLIMRQVKDILDRSAAHDQVLSGVCIYIIPMMDPDGVAISQYGVNGMKTQNMKNTVNGIMKSWSDWGLFENADKYIWYLNKWKNTGTGVDLNRNFRTNGWEGLNDLRSKPSNDLYKGPSPESEPETRAVAQLVRGTHFDEVLSYHAQGQILYWHAPTSIEAANTRSYELAEIINRDTGYSIVAADASGTGIGSLKTWLGEVMNVPCVTVEVGLGTCPLPESDLEGIWQRNKEVLYDLAKELRVGREQLYADKGWSTQVTAETAAAGAGDDSPAENAAGEAQIMAPGATQAAQETAAAATPAAQETAAAAQAAQGTAAAAQAAQGTTQTVQATQAATQAAQTTQAAVQAPGAAQTDTAGTAAAGTVRESQAGTIVSGGDVMYVEPIRN